MGGFQRPFGRWPWDRLMQCDNIVELAKELGISLVAAVVYVAREA